jgi:tagatose-6-phosphate ketose/aldose isomerase
MHLAITCNEDGQLARLDGVKSIVLDPRTNDHSLVMTGSFSNLVLAGLAVQHREVLALQLPVISATVRHVLPELESSARQLAARRPSRVVVLTPPGLASLGQEACLKILEMTGGHVVALPETYLGLRHGPMSFLTDDTLVVCILSSDQQRRLYELDLIRELQEKSLGYLVPLGTKDSTDGLCHKLVPAVAPDIPDELRTPFEIVFLQLLGYHLSFVLGLDPDNPSPSGVITRVVCKFELHEND